MKTKQVKVRLQQRLDGTFQVEQLVNAIQVHANWTTAKQFELGSKLTAEEADELCSNPGIEVTINAAGN